MPSDVTGSSIWNQRDGDFEFRPGPIFTNLLLADEINRAPPKTQAALLEAMQERQVTIEGVTHQLARPFLVLATQNPIEYEGTYPLPEAQLDRFLLRVGFGYPSRSDEWEVLSRRLERREDEVELEPVIDGADAARAPGRDRGRPRRRAVGALHRRARRGDAHAAARPRSAPARAAASPSSSSPAARRRSRAATSSRPDDVKAVAVPALAHRLMLKPELWVQRLSADDVVRDLLETRADAGGGRARAARRSDAVGVAAGDGVRRARGALPPRGARAPPAGAGACSRCRSRCRWRSASASRARRRSASGSTLERRPGAGGATSSPSSSIVASRAADRAARAPARASRTGSRSSSGESSVVARGSAGTTSARSSCGSAAPAGGTTTSATSACARATGSACSSGRRDSTGSTRLRVYPLPETLRRIVPPVATQPFTGNEVARQKGEGLEFADLRRSRPATASARSTGARARRRDELVVNERHPERNADVILFLDTLRGCARRRPLDPRPRRTRDLDARVALPRAPRPRRARLLRRLLRWLTPGMGIGAALPDRRRAARVRDRLQLRLEGRLDHPGAHAAAAGARRRDHAAARRPRRRGARRPAGARLRPRDRRGLAGGVCEPGRERGRPARIPPLAAAARRSSAPATSGSASPSRPGATKPRSTRVARGGEGIPAARSARAR